MSRKCLLINILTVLFSSFCLATTYSVSDEVITLGADDKKPQEAVQVLIDRGNIQNEPDITVSVNRVNKTDIKAPDGNTYTNLSILNCGNSAEADGLPSLPVKSFVVEIPFGVDVSVELIEQNVNTIGKNILIYPQQPPEMLYGEKPDFVIDTKAYSMDTDLPGTMITLDKPGVIRGRRMVIVRVCPFQYNPVTGELKAYSFLNFRLKYQSEIDQVAEADKLRLSTPASSSLLKSAELDSLTTESDLGGGEMMMASAGEGADYLIIVRDDLYDESDPNDPVVRLANWKYKKGFLTRIVNVAEICVDSNDRNDRDEIMDYMQNVYDTWNPVPAYVLLVGDTGFWGPLPTYWIPNSYGLWGGNATDQPYACLDGDDYYPDLAIGRLPAATEQQCAIMVDKILKYERDPEPGDWYEHFLSASAFEIASSSSHTNKAYFMSSSAHIKDYLESEVGMTTHTAWCVEYSDDTGFHIKDPPFEGDYYYLRNKPFHYYIPPIVPQEVVNLWTSGADATNDIITHINNGAGLVLHIDHGSYKRWGAPDVNVYDVALLNNGDKTPVIFSINCESGAFPYTDDSLDDSLAERFLRKANGGCVGIVASVNTGGYYYNELMTHGMFTSFRPEYNPDYTNDFYPNSWRPAEALTFGKFYMQVQCGGQPSSYNQHIFDQFHWLGDPEMMLRTQSPKTLDVYHYATLTGSSTCDITVVVREGDALLAGARAALTTEQQEDGVFYAGVTGPDGKVTLTGVNIEDIEQNLLDLTVTAHDFYPYELKIKYIWVDADYVGASTGGFDSPYTTIEDAIDNRTSDSDVIMVKPGTYYEQISFSGKFVIAGTNQFDDDVLNATVIDGNGLDDVVSFNEGNAQSVLLGVTVNGQTGFPLGIICNSGSTPVIESCKIVNCESGITCNNGSAPVIKGCKIEDNSLSGIYNAGSSKITNCKIAYNNDGITCNSGSAYIKNNWIYHNNSCGINVSNNAEVIVGNNTIVSNNTCGISNTASTITVSNCILWDNVDDLIGCSATYSRIENCDDCGQNGNICSEPKFTNPDNDHYYLLLDSPCINAGDPLYKADDDETDIEGEPRVQGIRIDMGADESLYAVYNSTQKIRYETIQDAIDDAAVDANEEIIVYPGTYEENINFLGKAITVRSSDPDNWEVVRSTVINGSYSSVSFKSGEGADSILNGFKFIDCIVAIECHGSSPTISHCLMEDDDTVVVAFDVFDGSPTIENCILSDLPETGISAINSPGLIVRNCLIYNIGCDAIAPGSSSCEITNCTIAGSHNGIYAINSSPTITNCILWDNTYDDLYGCSATYSCIERCDDADGIGNICGDANDPCFVDDNYHISNNSPCFNNGDPTGDYSGQVDIDGEPRVLHSIVDIGADETPVIWHVKADANGSGTGLSWEDAFNNIQDGIDAAEDIDEVVVWQGTYNESINFNGKAITVRSNYRVDWINWNVARSTIINGSPIGVYFVSGEGADSILKGFKIDNYYVGIRCYDSSPTIYNCLMEDKVSDGAAFDIQGGAPSIENCILADLGDTGIYVTNSSGLIVRNCLIYNIGCDAIVLGSSSAEITNCTIADSYKGINAYNNSTATVTNCILWGNEYNYLSGCTVSFSCIEGGYPGFGNISSDPLFYNNYYTLPYASPCIDAGNSNYDYTGQFCVYGNPRVVDAGKGDGYNDVDMGAFEWNGD